MEPYGLSLQEVSIRTNEGLVNKSKIPERKMFSHILWENIVNLFNVLVAPIIFILIKLGLYKEVISVAAITVANSIIGIFQETKAKIALDKISLIDVKKCVVIREGNDYEVPVDQVVMGDYIRIKPGDPVLADGKVVSSNHLEIDESLLTGESDYIPKDTASKVLSGSFCVSGSGVYTADSIGDESYINKLTKQAKKYRKFLSPIQHKVNDIIKYLISFAVVLSILLAMDYMAHVKLNAEKNSVIPDKLAAEPFEKNILAKSRDKEEIKFLKSVYSPDDKKNYYAIKKSLNESERLRISEILARTENRSKFEETVRAISAVIMTLIPQGLVLSITLIFIVGIIRMTGMGALINKPNSIESMAHVNVICMDKTGTLTNNKLTLRELKPRDKNDSDLNDLARIFASNAGEKNKTIQAMAAGLGEETCETLDEIPFSSLNKYSGLRVRRGGSLYDMVMGPLTSISRMLSLTDAEIAEIEKEISEQSIKGFRVVAFAVKQTDGKVPMRSLLAGFEFRGLVVFEDEIKPEAAKILDFFQTKKIELKIISGDHPETIKSIAQALNIRNSDRTITGYELEKLSPEEFEEAALHNTIFARVSPHQKLEIVKALQRDNRYVAMVGDGVNDALAIKEANLGISMGSGARVTKDVSEIILINDTFEIMPEILTQGRIIIQNVRDMAKLFLIKNSFSIILIFITQFLDLFFPFNPQQVTLFNFITITIPSTFIILFAKKGSDMDMDYLREILKYSVTAGFITAIFALAIGMFSMLYLGAGEPLYQTYIVSTVCLMGVFNFIYIFAWPGKARDLLDIKSNATGVISLALLPAAMYALDFINDFFVLEKLILSEWLTVLAFASLGMICTYLVCKFDLISKLYIPSEKSCK